LMPRMVKGFQVLEWQKPSGARNEPLDLCVYCLAVLELVKRRYNRATMWDQLTALLDKPATPAAGPRPARPSRPRSSGSFVNSW
jgi:phage terminase large subunit GpA-like protein